MNTIIEKIRVLIKMQIRREELNFASLGGGGQTMNIGALEWVLKQLDTLQEQPVDLDDAINNWQGIEAFPEGCGITPLPKATIVKQFKKMEVFSPVVISPSGQVRRRQRRAMERKFKMK